MVPEILRARATMVWLVLVGATIASWALGAEHQLGSSIGVAVLAIALIKVRFVGLDFMELRQAPVPLRAAFEGYCAVLFALLAGMYLWL